MLVLPPKLPEHKRDSVASVVVHNSKVFISDLHVLWLTREVIAMSILCQLFKPSISQQFLELRLVFKKTLLLQTRESTLRNMNR